MKVNEKFISIQGEGPFAGKVSNFIRMSECTLRCPYCDSKYAWKHGEKVDFGYIDNLLDYVSKGPNHVVITGGEPLIHYNNDLFNYFVERLVDNGFFVTFETTFILDKSDIKYKSIEENYFELLRHMGMKYFYNCNFVISPKLTFDSYKIDVTKDDIISFYEINSKFASDLKNNIFYKPIYNYKEPNDILLLINSIPNWFVNKHLLIMPYTPQPYNYDEYKLSCEKTAEFCIENELRYSPRIHVDIWGDKRGV